MSISRRGNLFPDEPSWPMLLVALGGGLKPPFRQRRNMVGVGGLVGQDS
jgi:hypothetical protein